MRAKLIVAMSHISKMTLEMWKMRDELVQVRDLVESLWLEGFCHRHRFHHWFLISVRFLHLSIVTAILLLCFTVLFIMLLFLHYLLSIITVYLMVVFIIKWLDIDFISCFLKFSIFYLIF